LADRAGMALAGSVNTQNGQTARKHGFTVNEGVRPGNYGFALWTGLTSFDGWASTLKCLKS
jgi:hypothetical protein